jgi:hypothetical protein
MHNFKYKTRNLLLIYYFWETDKFLKMVSFICNTLF